MDWISVEEQLPPPDKCWVLVYADGTQNCMAYVKDHWEDWVGASYHNIDVSSITHWMPLPEDPPKKED